jgi:uncharacterized protein YkwD
MRCRSLLAASMAVRREASWCMTRSIPWLWLALALAHPAAAQPKKPDLDAVERSVLAFTNDLRRENGLPPLRSNTQLSKAAQGFADFMAQREEYGHEADGRTPAQRARAAGYKDCMVAENIAYQMRTRGFESAELALAFASGWAKSPGHRRNMLDPEVVEVGIAAAYSDETSRYYGVQLFGRPESMRVSFEVRNESRQDLRYKVGDQAYTLQARTERRHHVCGDVRVVFERRGGEKPSRPGDGDRYVVTPAGNVEHVPRG